MVWNQYVRSTTVETRQCSNTSPHTVGYNLCGNWRRKQDGAHTHGVIIKHKNCSPKLCCINGIQDESSCWEFLDYSRDSPHFIEYSSHCHVPSSLPLVLSWATLTQSTSSHSTNLHVFLCSPTCTVHTPPILLLNILISGDKYVSIQTHVYAYIRLICTYCMCTHGRRLTCACMSVTILNNIYPLSRTTGTRARVAADGWKNEAMSWPLDSTSFETPR